MQSWIGGRRVDLSTDAWSRVFNLPPVSEEDEREVMNLTKEELFFRLTGQRDLGIQPFIRINQLHQEANVRLSAQIVMNVLIPKKGSKEQIKVEEGRLLYAMIYERQIDLTKMIVERIKAAMGRKSIPICYGMHLMEMMAQAGVDVTCAGDKEEVFSSVIDHHTLRRLGYRLQLHTWTYVGRGKVNTNLPAAASSDHEADTEAEEPHEETAQAESAAPSQPPPRRPTSVHSEIAHLRNFMLEQFHLLQATLMSKLESMDSRLQTCEAHLVHHPRTSPIRHPPPHPSDPKGKAPMVSPVPSPAASPIHISSPHTSPAPTPHLSSPPPSPLAQKSPTPEPVPIPSEQSSSSSSESPSQEFELTARTPASPHSSTMDSEATPSDPSRYVTPPPSPAPPPSQPPASTRSKRAARKNPSYTPSPPSSPQPSTVPPAPSPQTALTPYTRRKLAVSRPPSSPPPPPPQP